MQIGPARMLAPGAAAMFGEPRAKSHVAWLWETSFGIRAGKEEQQLNNLVEAFGLSFGGGQNALIFVLVAGAAQGDFDLAQQRREWRSQLV
jgi:hypothetical protein